MTSGAIMNLFVFWLSLYCGIAIIMIFFMIFIIIPLGLMAEASSPDMALVLSIGFWRRDLRLPPHLPLLRR